MIEYNIDGKIVKITPQKDIDAVLKGGEDLIARKSVINLIDGLVKDLGNAPKTDYIDGLKYALEAVKGHVLKLKSGGDV